MIGMDSGQPMAMDSEVEEVMEERHVMTNDAEDSIAMSGGPKKLVESDSERAAAMTVSQSMSLGEGPLTLELLTGPSGLPKHFPMLVAGLGVVESSLFDPNGEIVWSTDPGAIGQSESNISLVRSAVAGTISSKLVRDSNVVRQDGTGYSMDVVSTYVPLQASTSSPVVGVLEIKRGVGTELGALVDGTKSTVLWTTVATMGGLFLTLVGFVVVSDRIIVRSHDRQIVLVENQLAERKVAQEHLRRANEELVEAQDQVVKSAKLVALGQLSGGVAHDLRNPIGAIKNAAYIVSKTLFSGKDGGSSPKLEKYMGVIDDQIAKSEHIITGLMSFARVAALKLTKTHLDKTLEESLETMVKNDNVVLLWQLDPNLDPVMADGDQLRRVFLNLANNAQEAMPDGGTLTITATGVNNQVEIAFSDTGVGISDENIGKIFEPLFTTKSDGTGLGLAVCQEIVQQHGGTIGASRNPEPDCGSTFAIRLPVADNEPRPKGEDVHD